MSRNGWLCCGGETGEFAALRLDSPQNSNSSTSAAVLDMLESRLAPANSPSSSTLNTAEDAMRSIVRSLYPTSQRFGKERVNCITLWFPDPDFAKQRAYSQPVAVLSNNDKNVTFVTLKEGGSNALDTISYPDCVNRAVISPDGTICAAICDDPYLYIHERTRKLSKEGGCHWVLRRKIHVKSQRRNDRTDNRGSFAVCFNRTGRYLAVGTQYGVVSLFEVTLILDVNSDPLLTTFESSRHNTEAGAVRDMAFCPGPFDLLAWTEDRGRVGIADVRRNCFSRQIIHMDRADDFEHFDIINKQSVERLAPGDSLVERYESLFEENSAGSNNTSSNNTSNNVSSTNTSSNNTSRNNNSSNLTSVSADSPSEDRRASISRALEAEIRRYNAPLSREETMVLDAMRDLNRRRREAENVDSNSGGAHSQISSSNNGNASTSTNRPARERSASVTRNLSGDSRLVRHLLAEASSNWRENTPGSGTPRLRERYWADSLRRGAMQPRRAGRLGENTANGTSTSTGPSPSGAGSRPAGRTGWGELDALYSLVEFDAETRRELDIFFRPGSQHNMLRDFDESRATYGRGANNEEDETAGMSWSEDGRIL